jgi:16S rRNA (cytosine1402-N4)-methyltransferase
MEGYHDSVLLKEVVEALVPKGTRDAWILDATLGDGGHTIAMLRTGMKVLGIDQDPQALERVQQRLLDLGIDSSFRLEQRNFSNLSGLGSFKGILFDLGVSSLQLLDPIRGFSIRRSGPLDMRMNPELGVKAADLLNGLNKGELYELFSKLGEEDLAKPISEAIIRTREVKPFETTEELADLVNNIYRKFHVNSNKIHPATKVFQALRIAVNDELNSLKSALPQAISILEPKGKIVVLSFHSLEDKIVKEIFKDWQEKGLGTTLTKKPITPTDDEISQNPYSRSVKMRIFQKT